MDMWALHGSPWQLGVARVRCWAPQVGVRLFLHTSHLLIPVPSPFTNSQYLFLYSSGTRSTRLANRKIYFSSHETRLSILLRRTTRSIRPPRLPLWNTSVVWNVLGAHRLSRTGCSISMAWRAIFLQSKHFAWTEGAVVDWECFFNAHRHDVTLPEARIHYGWSNQCAVCVSWISMYHTIRLSDLILYHHTFCFMSHIFINWFYSSHVSFVFLTSGVLYSFYILAPYISYFMLQPRIYIPRE